ncbi:toll/interleukin-1 receptor domain-containing protein [bacterium]|nr:toll/interleukin-1 receptor domain-containing protein [bacterium]
MADDIFICYAREDSQYIDTFLTEFNEESKGREVKLIPRVDTSVIDLGDRYREKIVKTIERSSGAVLFISDDFSKSNFIKEVEIPAILKQKELNPNFLIIPIFIDKTINFDERIMSYQSTNTEETALRDLNLDLRKLVINNSIKQIFSFFEDLTIDNAQLSKKSKKSLPEYLTEKRIRRNLFFVLISLIAGASYFYNTRIAEEVIISPQDQLFEELETTEPIQQRGSEAYLGNLRIQMSDDSVGEISILTDVDLVNHATWICSSLSYGVEGYFVYDALWFLIAQDLQKYNVSGDDITESEIGLAQYYIFNFSNDYYCESKTQMYDIESMYNLHSSIMKNNMRDEEDRWNFKSNFLTDMIPNMYFKRQSELLDTLSPSPSLVGYFFETDEMYRSMIENSCSNILLKEDEEAIDYIQRVFDLVGNLEEQNYHLDSFTIMFEMVPQLFCEEHIDRGIAYSTYLYFIERKF